MNTETAPVKLLGAGSGRAFALMGSSLTFKDEPAENGDALFAFEHRIPPGDGVPPHSERNHEAFYGLDGVLEVVADGQRHRIEPGVFLSIQPGIIHALHNPGAGWARVLTIVSPGSQHERFFSTLGEAIDDPANPPQFSKPLPFERVQQVASDCGIDFLPPPPKETMPEQSSTSDRVGRAPGPHPSGLAIRQLFAKLPAHDIERARAFYRETFDLEPYSEHNKHLHYEVDGGYFIIFPSAGNPSGSHDQLGFVVDDVEATVAKLRSRGVELEDYEPPPHATRHDGITDFGAVKAAWLKDSEGNLVSLGQFTNGTPFARHSI